jgi:hypothetical protein
MLAEAAGRTAKAGTGFARASSMGVKLRPAAKLASGLLMGGREAMQQEVIPMSLNGVGGSQYRPQRLETNVQAGTLSAEQRIAVTRQGLERLKDHDRFSQNRQTARADQAFAKAYYADAMSDGVLTRDESRMLDAARRDELISGLRVDLDERLKQLGELEVTAARDGVISPDEARQLCEARSQVNLLIDTMQRHGGPSIGAEDKSQWMRRKGRPLV